MLNIVTGRTEDNTQNSTDEIKASVVILDRKGGIK